MDERKVKALDLMVMLRESGTTAEDLVEGAKKIEAYLKDEPTDS